MPRLIFPWNSQIFWRLDFFDRGTKMLLCIKICLRMLLLTSEEFNIAGGKLGLDIKFIDKCNFTKNGIMVSSSFSSISFICVPCCKWWRRDKILLGGKLFAKSRFPGKVHVLKWSARLLEPPDVKLMSGILSLKIPAGIIIKIKMILICNLRLLDGIKNVLESPSNTSLLFSIFQYLPLITNVSRASRETKMPQCLGCIVFFTHFAWKERHQIV